MLDPLTALSLASSVVQLVDFSTKLLTESKEIYQKGSTLEHKDLGLLTEDLSLLSNQLERSSAAAVSSNASSDQQALQKLAQRCSEVASELGQALDSVKTAGEYRRVNSLLSALRVAWGKDRLDALVQKLHSFRDELELRLLVDLRNDTAVQAVRHDQRFNSMTADLRAVANTILDGNSKVFDALSDVSYNLNQLQHTLEMGQRTTDTLVQQSHDQIMDAITALHISPPPDSTHPSRSLAEPLIFHSRIVAAANRAVLENLRFRGIGDREQDVATAHDATFKWILQDSSDQGKPGSNFVKWLRGGSGCYWINGKAGSGKSTLMKYIIRQPRILYALREWAGAAELIIASHFFWNLGTALQKTQVGLLRSILHSILDEHRELIAHTLPGYYNEVAKHVEETERRRRSPEVEPLTDVEIAIAFRKMLVALPPDCRVCLFVDGLDEFTGDYTDLAEMFKSAASTKVKVVVSSRPMRSFIVAFSTCPGLRLQDLTKDDITAYVDAQITNHERMLQLRKRQPREAKNLVDEIVGTASGVFLWVVLVVKALLRGLEAFDDMDDLKRKLNAFPPELDHLYQHMMEQMEPDYRISASMYLQIALKSSIVQSQFPLSLLQMSFANESKPSCVLELDKDVGSEEEIALRCEATDARITSRCCGLLEAVYQEDDWAGARVTFLHRSVAEFLEQDETRSYVTQLTAGLDYTVAERLRDACYALLKIYMDSHTAEAFKSAKFVQWARCIFHYLTEYCRYIEEVNSGMDFSLIQACAALFDNFEINEIYGNYGRSLDSGDGFLNASGEQTSFPSTSLDILPDQLRDTTTSLSLAVCYYLPKHLQSGLELCITKQPRWVLAKLLFAAVDKRVIQHATSARRDSDLCKTVEVLLKSGADPNSLQEAERSPWTRVLSDLSELYDETRVAEKYSLILCRLLICEALATSGANANAVVSVGKANRGSQAQAVSALYIIEGCKGLYGEAHTCQRRLVPFLLSRRAMARVWDRWGNVISGPPSTASLEEHLANPTLTGFEIKQTPNALSPETAKKKGKRRSVLGWRSRSKSPVA